mmetsp:Transcript_9024/g.13925  ORF Transcript_9024/g.13925 Transcript_9024/m.13925 type:complete len:228 (-) Transcript_9024:104-787(-)
MFAQRNDPFLLVVIPRRILACFNRIDKWWLRWMHCHLHQGQWVDTHQLGRDHKSLQIVCECKTIVFIACARGVLLVHDFQLALKLIIPLECFALIRRLRTRPKRTTKISIILAHRSFHHGQLVIAFRRNLRGRTRTVITRVELIRIRRVICLVVCCRRCWLWLWLCVLRVVRVRVGVGSDSRTLESGMNSIVEVRICFHGNGIKFPLSRSILVGDGLLLQWWWWWWW